MIIIIIIIIYFFLLLLYIAPDNMGYLYNIFLITSQNMSCYTH